MAQLVKQLVTHHVHTRVHHSSSSNNLHPLNSTQQRVSTSRREVFNIYISFLQTGKPGHKGWENWLRFYSESSKDSGRKVRAPAPRADAAGAITEARNGKQEPDTSSQSILPKNRRNPAP